MDEIIGAFLDHLRLEIGASDHTLKAYRDDLAALLSSLNQSLGRDVLPEDLTTVRLRRYLASLHDVKLAKSSVARRLASLRTFTKYLCRQGFLDKNPSVGLRTPKMRKHLPEFLSRDEVDQLLDAPNVATPLGKRDRAILELFYSSGLRVSELVGANVSDVDQKASVLMVRGKGKRERVSPIGSHAMNAIQDWLGSRGQVSHKSMCDLDALFWNKFAQRLSVRSVARILVKYLEQAGIKTHASPHTLRHSFATHMLDEGADIRSVQELLGHRSLSSTQIYTHVTSQKMRETYLKAHPRARKKDQDPES